MSEHALPAVAVPSADAREARHAATTTAASTARCPIILSEHVREALGSDPARPGYGRFVAPRVRTEYHASSRGAGERFTTRTLKDCALVLWAICESADATRKKIIPPARLSLLERFNKKGPEDCESFSA